MHERAKRRVFNSDNLVRAVACLLAISAVIVEFRLGMPQKWHAATAWTLVSFSVAVAMYRRYWASRRFWAALVVCLVLHLTVMWVIFARMLQNVKWMGTMYVIPLELLEVPVLAIAVGLVMRKLGHKEKYIRLV
jgi:hypothetical protein